MLNNNLNFLLIIILLYLVYKNYKTEKNLENLSNTDSTTSSETIPDKKECIPESLLEPKNDLDKEINNLYDDNIVYFRELNRLATVLESDNAKIKDDLRVRGKLIVKKECNLVPTGCIFAFSGTKIPDGWLLCNGLHGTPDLTSRFIISADDDKYKKNIPGGSNKHTLTVSEMPTHNHNGNTEEGGRHSHSVNNWKLCADQAKKYCGKTKTMGWNDGCKDYKWGWAKSEQPVLLKEDWNHKHNLNNLQNQGNSEPHNNMPPYYALAWIMKAPSNVANHEDIDLQVNSISEPVNENECLKLAKSKYGDKVTMVRENLVKGNWSHVPKGCSVQSGGDWAAHYNTGDGEGYSTYTEVRKVNDENSCLDYAKQYLSKKIVEIKTTKEMVFETSKTWVQDGIDYNNAHTEARIGDSSKERWLSYTFSCSPDVYKNKIKGNQCKKSNIFDTNSAWIGLDLGELKHIASVNFRGNTGGYRLPGVIMVYVSKTKKPGNSASSTDKNLWSKNAVIESVYLTYDESDNDKVVKRLTTTKDFYGRYVYFSAAVLYSGRAEFGYVGVSVFEPVSSSELKSKSKDYKLNKGNFDSIPTGCSISTGSDMKAYYNEAEGVSNGFYIPIG